MGVTPNTAWLDGRVFRKRESGEVEVDECMESNIQGVFCAGDACHVRLEEENAVNAWFQMKLWSQSQTMGWIAAHAMAMESVEEREEELALQFNFEIFGHFTRFLGQKCVFLGKYNADKGGDDGVDVIMRVKPGEEFIKLIRKDGCVIGAVLIGDTDLEETFENLILNKTDISCYGDDFLKFNVDLEAMFD